MPSAPFVSFAQNREDVVLNRVFKDIDHGRYLDVGANDPTIDSISRPFYDRGWRGLAVEPVPGLAAAFRRERPEDVVAEVAVTDAEVEDIELFSIPGTGLSSLHADITHSHAQTGRGTVDTIRVKARTLTSLLDELGWHDEPIHFMNLDVEGAEPEALRSLDLTRYRPWVLVIESLAPDSAEAVWDAWEPRLLESGYLFGLFDGLSRFYIAQEHADLLPTLQPPANVFDNYIIRAHADAQETVTQLQTQVAELVAQFDGGESEREFLRSQNSELVRMLDHQQLVAAAQLDRAASLDRRTESLTRQIKDADKAALSWRSKALGAWADVSAHRESAGPELHTALHGQAQANQHIVNMQNTLSWRITRPLRAVRRRMIR